MNWLGATLDDDPTGHALLEAGVKRDTLLGWTKDPQVDLDGTPTSLFDAFEDLNVPQVLKLAQKLGGDPFEDTPKFASNQAFMFIKPQANNLNVRSLVKAMLRDAKISIVDEGEIDAVSILEKQLIDNHYYAIANKASLTKPADLNVPAAKLPDFESKFGRSWDAALASGAVYNAVDACEVLGVDADALDAMWAAAKGSGDLLKFGGGFYCGRLPKPSSAVVPSAGGDLLGHVALAHHGHVRRADAAQRRRRRVGEDAALPGVGDQAGGGDAQGGRDRRLQE